MSFKLEITAHKLPTSVRFLVISDEFEDLSRAARIRFLAEAINKTFEMALTLGPMGLALTPKQAKDFSNDQNAEAPSMPNTGGNTAARPHNPNQ